MGQSGARTEKPLQRKLCLTLLPFLLTVLWAPTAQSSPLRLEVAISYFETPSWVTSSSLDFSIFEASYNAWATPEALSVRESSLAEGGGVLTSGMTQYAVTLPVSGLSNLFISMSGSFVGFKPESGDLSGIFVAEPPVGYVSDEMAFEHGPPWISLSSGLHREGDLYVIFGYGSQENSPDPYLVGTWSVDSVSEAVPEPGTLLLLGIGIAGLVRARRKK